MARKFGRRRWRRPQRLTLDGPPVARRKDLVVPAMLLLEPSETWRGNRRRMAALLVAFLGLGTGEGLLLVLIGAPWPVLPVLPALGFAYLVAGARFGDAWMRRALRAEPARHPEIANMVDGVAAQAAVPPPEIFVAGGEAPNAIALGLRRRWVVLTTSAMRLGRLELEGVIAHEIAHLRDGDAALTSAYVLIAGAAELAAKATMATGGLLVWLSLPLWPACVVIRTLGRYLFPADREHRADVVGALLTRYPPGMQRALAGATGEHGTSPLRTSDPFWFAPRTGTPGPDAGARAALVAEM